MHGKAESRATTGLKMSRFDIIFYLSANRLSSIWFSPRLYIISISVRSALRSLCFCVSFLIKMASASKQLMARHPLQRLSSPSRGSSALLHVLSLCSFAASFWYLNHWPTMINDSYGVSLAMVTRCSQLIVFSGTGSI